QAGVQAWSTAVQVELCTLLGMQDGEPLHHMLMDVGRYLLTEKRFERLVTACRWQLAPVRPASFFEPAAAAAAEPVPADAARGRQRREQETPAEAEQRLAAEAERSRQRRERETPAATEQRLAAKAERSRQRRERETPAEAEQRLAIEAERSQQRREQETPAEEQHRRAADAERSRQRRERETPAAAEEWLAAGAVRDQQRRKRKAEERSTRQPPPGSKSAPDALLARAEDVMGMRYFRTEDPVVPELPECIEELVPSWPVRVQDLPAGTPPPQVPYAKHVDLAVALAQTARETMASRVCAMCSCVWPPVEVELFLIEAIPNVELLRANMLCTPSVLRHAHTLFWRRMPLALDGRAPAPPDVAPATFEKRNRSQQAQAAAAAAATVNALVDDGSAMLDDVDEGSEDEEAAACSDGSSDEEDARVRFSTAFSDFGSARAICGGFAFGRFPFP
ncbi:hypothetical protein TSOC_012101, partial [Tetrabaena socialis]